MMNEAKKAIHFMESNGMGTFEKKGLESVIVIELIQGFLNPETFVRWEEPFTKNVGIGYVSREICPRPRFVIPVNFRWQSPGYPRNPQLCWYSHLHEMTIKAQAVKDFLVENIPLQEIIEIDKNKYREISLSERMAPKP